MKTFVVSWFHSTEKKIHFLFIQFQSLEQIVALVVTLVMVGALANPVAPVAADEEADDDGHDLETAESLLEIIEKKIAKLIKVKYLFAMLVIYMPLISIMS